METQIVSALAFYPPAPSNGGSLTAETPPKIGEWVWQPKIDDWRGVVHAPSQSVWNQYGERSVVERQRKIDEALDFLKHQSVYREPTFEWFDIGIMENRHDMMRGSIIVFDVMDLGLIHRDRRAILEIMFPVLPIAHKLLENGQVRNQVYLINEWRTQRGSYALSPMGFESLLKSENEMIGHKFYEGLVAKRADALYPVCSKAKQKTPMWVKHRFDQ
jgi:hypothetical protein